MLPLLPTTSGAIGTTVSGSNGSNMLSLGLQVDWMVWCIDATATATPFPAAAEPQQALQPQSQQHGNVPVQHQHYHHFRIIIINNFPKHNLNLTTRGPGDRIQLAR